jgi:hypothetical protein
VSTSGVIDNLAAQASSVDLMVGLGSADTSAAGTKSGTATISLESDGTGTSGIAGNVGLGTQTVNVTGAVYRLAQGDTTPLTVSFANRHVGDSANQALTIQNLAANDGYSESLNAGFGTPTGTGVTTNGGSVSLLAAQDSNNVAMAVGIDTTTAGAKSGTVAVNYQSDGTGTSGLTAIGAGSQTVSVAGNVYRLASAQIDNPAAFSFGNVHVGDTVTQTLSITNAVVNDGFSEKLDASFGSSSDVRITTSGSIGLLGAGATDSTSMVIGVNTAAAGSVNGAATVLFASNGEGTSGLGITVLPSQDVVVSAAIVEGAVFRLANAAVQTGQPVDFGNVRIGTAVAEQALSIKNDVPDDGFSEKLNASANGTTGGVTASGSFNLLAAQGVNSTDILVGLSTSVAGDRSGTATINFVSDGEGTSGLGQTPLPSQNVQVTGAVYRLANPVLNTANVTLAARVGDSSPQVGVSVTNSSPDMYTEGLKAGFASTPAGFIGSAVIANLAAGGTDASTLQVALATATSGTFGGNAVVDFVSTGADTTGAADIGVGSANVNLTGKVYTPAVGQVLTSPVNFGIVHVGDVVAAKAVAVQNAAAVTALNDTLAASFGAVAGPFSGSGSVSGLGAGASSSALSVALSTAGAGVFSTSAGVNFLSQNPEMADLALAAGTVELLAQVNNYADADLLKTDGAGSLSGGVTAYTLDFGNVVLDSALRTASLAVLNAVLGPADLLAGMFDLTGADGDFSLTGFTAFSGVVAGASFGGLSVGFDPTALGRFSDQVVLAWYGSNAGGYTEVEDPQFVTLLITGNVVTGQTVPEPSILVLFLTAGGALLVAGRRRRR